MRNASKFNLRLSVISVGVIALFSISSAMADDEEIKALTQPKSTVQVEVIGVDQNSAKFGEYNGLYGHPSGAYPNGALNVRGGSAYTNNEQGDTTRWSVTGDNLGLTSRSAGAGISDQGSWSLNLNYDQLQHNITDSYQTPYQGKMGGTLFTLPSNLQGTKDIVTNAGNVTQDLQTMTISSTRYNTTVSGATIVDKNLNFTFEYNNLIQSGAKLQGFSGSNVGATASNGSAISILPNPTNYTTDTINVGANWKSENAHLTASYFGSFFKNQDQGVQWQVFNKSAAGANPNTPTDTMSLAPSNVFNQLNLGGGYDFSNKTKLTGNVSVGQNTQNQGYGGSYDSIQMVAGLPQASMNGLVNTSHADVKVTDQSIQDLMLTAGYKFDQRDNLSQSNMYNFYSIGSAYTGYIPNTPLSNKQQQLLLSGDYRLTKDQRVGLALSNNTVNRWCNQYGSPGTQSTNTASGYPTNFNSYYNSPNCASATSSNENKADLTYKIKASEAVNVKLAAGYANRKTQWDQNVIAAMPYGTEIQYPTNQPAGYNSANVLGFYPFFEASRKQFLGKGSVTWQADDKLAFTFGGKYVNDLYPDSKYGVTNGNSWSLNLDGTYSYSEVGNLVGYVTQQNQQRFLTNVSGTTNSGAGQGNPTGSWTNTLQNTATTLGLGVRQGELADGKLSLSADATYSLAKSAYSTAVSSTSNCAAAATQSCGILPGINNTMAAIKLGGAYQLDKNSKIGLMYWYQHLYSNDFYYNAYQNGSTMSSTMPTNQTSPSYNVNVISANYTYTFD